MVLSKALGGSLPLSVVLYHESLDQWQPGAHAGTFRGNQMAMAAGIATLRYLQEHRLADQAEVMGNRLLAQLKQIQTEFPCLGDVRGRGLMVGAEVVDVSGLPNAQGSYPADPVLARRIQQECLRRGLILELGGRYNSVVRFLPPLIVTAEQIDRIGEIVHAALQAVDRAFTLTSSEVN